MSDYCQSGRHALVPGNLVARNDGIRQCYECRKEYIRKVVTRRMSDPDTYADGIVRMVGYSIAKKLVIYPSQAEERREWFQVLREIHGKAWPTREGDR